MADQLMDRRKIGETIRKKRLEIGASVTALALACGVSPQAVAMYESGSRIPRDEVKIRIANYLGTKVSDIFFA